MSLKLSLIFVIILTKRSALAAEEPTPPESEGAPQVGIASNGSDTYADTRVVISINPNYDVVEDLICYQCHSNTSTDIQPLCDENIFKMATPEEKYNMSLQCPSYQGAFCFLKVITNGTARETSRGCSGSRDKNRQLMKTGCMWKENLKICLCDVKFCNVALDVKPGTIFILISFFLVYHFTSFTQR